MTHGLACVKLDDAVISLSGVEGGGIMAAPSFTGFRGGDFVSFDPDPFLLLSFSSFSFSSLALFSFSRSSFSLTASAERFRTRPAASKAVVALCIILTLPERGFPDLLSLLLVLPAGVVGVDLPVAVPVCESATDGVGDSSERGDLDRGGVVGW
jgi:hypothetical protein